MDEKYFHGKIPTWNNFIGHPNYDEFWQRQSLPYRLDAPTVPTMHVAGWWDQEDFYGPIKTYEVLEKKDTKHLNYLVVGPWESWRLEWRRREEAWQYQFRYRDFTNIQGVHPGSVVCLLAEG